MMIWNPMEFHYFQLPAYFFQIDPTLFIAYDRYFFFSGRWMELLLPWWVKQLQGYLASVVYDPSKSWSGCYQAMVEQQTAPGLRVCVCAGPFRKSVGFVLPRMPELTEEQAMNQFFSMSVSNSATAKGLWVFGPLFGAFAQTVWIQIVWTKRFESDNVAYKFQLPFQIESRQACGTSMKAWGLNASCLAPLCYLPPGLSLLRGHWEWDDSAGRFWEGMARSIVCLFLLKDKDLVVEVWGSFKWCFRD